MGLGWSGWVNGNGGGGGDLDLGVGCEEAEQVLHVNHGLLDGAVIGAKVVEGRIQLLHHGDEENCISHTQAPVRYSLKKREMTMLRTFNSTRCYG